MTSTRYRHRAVMPGALPPVLREPHRSAQPTGTGRSALPARGRRQSARPVTLTGRIAALRRLPSARRFPDPH